MAGEDDQPPAPPERTILQQRGTLVTTFKNNVSRLNVLMVQKNVDGCKAKFEAVKTSYNDFLSFHVKNNIDMEHTDIDELLISATQRYEKFLSTGSFSGEIVSESDIGSVRLVHAAPTPTPTKFSGDVNQFWRWKTSLQAMMSRTSDIHEQANLLLSSVEGRALGWVENCLQTGGSDRVKKAMDMLDMEFGTKEHEAYEYLARLDRFPPLEEGDRDAFEDFAILLERGLILQKRCPGLIELPGRRSQVLGKLPDRLQKKLIGKLVDKGDQGSSEGCPSIAISIEEIAKEVSRERKILKHPLRAAQVQGTCLASHQVMGRVSPSSVASPRSQVGRENTCSSCQSAEHRVEQCPELANLSQEDRKAEAYRKRLCFNCLQEGHMCKDCPKPSQCQVCQQNHHTILHRYHLSLAGVSSQLGAACSTSILPVLIRHQGTGKTVTVYALLDSMSNTNFVSTAVVSALGLKGEASEITLDTMNGIASQSSFVIRNLSVQGLGEEAVLSVPLSHVRDRIPCDRRAIPQQEFVALHPHLSAVKLPPMIEGAPVGMLLGYQVASAFCPLQVASKDIDSPFGIRTPLGWCVMGGIKGSPKVAATCLNTVEVQDLPELPFDQLFHPPLPSILHNHVPNMEEASRDGAFSQEDLRFLEIMTEKMHPMSDGHLKAPLPLKPQAVFPNNLFVARSRLSSLKRKFERQPETKDRYVAAMEDMISQGFAEKCPLSHVPGRVWYIPHHAVVTDKMRIVFDCSVKLGQVSLNEALLQGPDLMNSLLGILLRFRSNTVALSCDIQKMFHQFYVGESDRDLLRFLWWPEGDLGKEPYHFRMCVHLFGATSSPGVATFGLRKIATDFGPRISPSATHFIQNNFYVDDGLLSVHSVTEAVEIFRGTREILSQGGLTCHKLKSNSEEVLASFPEEERATLGETDTKTLGIPWNTKQDLLSVRFVVEGSELTRRGLLSVLAKTYDPLGFMAPIALYGKSILQDMTRQKLAWDEKPPPALQKRIQRLKDMADSNTPVEVSRPMFREPHSELTEIHIFCDASQIGYAAVAYARYKTPTGQFVSSFLLGKSRVAPLKPALTIPRLELVAAVQATSLYIVLRREMNLRDCQLFFWTDSLVVLGYLNNQQARYRMFVANRISFIVSNTSPGDWRHIRGVDNPADVGSRGIWSAIWIQGPSFLTQRVTGGELPSASCGEGIPDLDPQDLEVLCLNTVDTPNLEMTLYVAGTWMQTLRMWAWLRRWRHVSATSKPLGEALGTQEIREAQTALLKRIQQIHFEREITSLGEGRPVAKSSRLRRLDPFLDQFGVLRVGGRLGQARLPSELVHPAIVPGKSDLATLIIQHYHNLTHHQGRGLTIAEIRRGGFWILGLTHRVKSVIHACVICAKLRGSPVEQRMANLPEERLTPTPPFTNCGCDNFGPFEVKQGRSRVKRWVLIITCMYSRAIHLESVHSLSTDSFCQAFKRLTSVRGPVRLMICDQGTNFVGARHFLTNQGCEVRFNPPSASHFGGFYERLIGTSRRILEAILLQHAQTLNDESFRTLLAETAWVANCRPLSVETLNDPLSLTPLTANMLLTQKSSQTLDPDERVPPEELYARVQWKRVRYLAQLFASRWQGEILLLLQERQKWEKPRRNLQTGDVVMMVDENQPRSLWRMARVTQVKVSADGLVRSCTVTTAEQKEYERPVQKLIHLLTPN